jgi:uncharacterized protein
MLYKELRIDEALVKFPKIDAHSHVSLKNGRLNTDELERLLEGGNALGIEKICVSIPFTGPGLDTAPPEAISEANNAVLEAVRRYEGRVLGYVFVHCGYKNWAQQEIERCLKSREMIGIKLYHQYFFNEKVVFDTVQIAVQMDAIILLHQGKVMDSATQKRQPFISDGSHIAELGRQFPSAKIVCGHILGGGDWEWTVKALKEVPSVYVDTGGSGMDMGAIEFAARTLGTDRILFATDLVLEEGVGKILGANITTDAKKAIFWTNFNKLLGQGK